MEKNKLISLAESFIAFLIEEEEIEKAILFGSVANNEFDEESDIDIFIETNKKKENKIRKILEKFEKSETYEKYKLRKIKNKISLTVGKINEWKDLKRSIISNGIILYGKYTEKPDKLKQYFIFSLEYKNQKRNNKIKLWRKLYGYRQKIGKKIYETNGLVKSKLGKGCVMANVEDKNKIIELLKKYKIKYKIYEIWSDTIN